MTIEVRRYCDDGFPPRHMRRTVAHVEASPEELRAEHGARGERCACGQPVLLAMKWSGPEPQREPK